MLLSAEGFSATQSATSILSSLPSKGVGRILFVVDCFHSCLMLSMRPALAGALFTASVCLFSDGAITAGREAQQALHYTFLMVVPFVLTLVGYVLMMLTRPSSMKENKDAREAAIFVCSWMMMLSASIIALVLAYLHFVETQRQFESPGVSLVLQTCCAALSAAIMWTSRAPKRELLL